MRISLVAPMYNESAGIAEFSRQLDELLPVLRVRGEVEVLLVDDGSRDGTAEALATLAREGGHQVLTHELNRGVGAALWTGFSAAIGEVIVAVDSDCTYPLKEVDALLERLTDDVDIVTASPYHPTGGVEGGVPLRLFLSRSLSLLYSLLMGQRLYTWTAMFRAYRNETLAHMPHDASGFVAVTQMLVLPMLAGYRVAEYPTVLYGRRFGQSKMKVARVIGQHLRFIAWLIPRRMRGGPRRRGTGLRRPRL